jgi:hypothetical protein
LSSPQKKQKGKSLEMLLCRTKPLPCKSGKTCAGKVCGHSAHTGPCAAKIFYALPLRKATLVLPDFARSCSTDGKKRKEKAWASDNKGGPA